MTDENHAQVVRMLEDALALVRSQGGLGIEMVVTTADGVSCYRYYAPDDSSPDELAALAAMPAGRVQ